MSLLRGQVTIDCFPESLARYGRGWTVVAVDVIRATTTAVTAVAAGRACFPAFSIETATVIASRLPDALLVGELGGSLPYGFHVNNSPAALAQRTDLHRPMVLLSTSGTKLFSEKGPREAVYAACLRNVAAQIDQLIGRHDRVAVIGAGARGEFREEDQLVCARIADGLMRAGYQPLQRTARIVTRWRDAPVHAVLGGKSAAFLRRTGQVADLDFIASHIEDVAETFELDDHGLLARAWSSRSPGTRRELADHAPRAGS